MGDEAVAMALFGQEERAPLEQRLRVGTADLPLEPAGQVGPSTEDHDRFAALCYACERQRQRQRQRNTASHTGMMLGDLVSSKESKDMS